MILLGGTNTKDTVLDDFWILDLDQTATGFELSKFLLQLTKKNTNYKLQIVCLNLFFLYFHNNFFFLSIDLSSAGLSSFVTQQFLDYGFDVQR